MKKISASISASILIFAVIIVLAGCATPFIDAAYKGDINTVKALLAKGVNVNEKDSGARTALHLASINGQTEIARILLDNGADVNAKAGPSQLFERTLTPLHYAAMSDVDNVDIVRLLLDRGANINAKSDTGRTALHYAANNGHVYIVRLLIDRGANNSIADYKNKTPLILAQEKGYTIIVRLLTDTEEARYKKILAKEETPSVSGSFEKAFAPSVQTDVDELPAIKAKPNKNSYAIVIGIEQYRQKLPKADFAVHDAKIMTDYLTKVMGYPEENVVTLINDRALKSDMEKYFEKWLSNNVEKDSTVFVYYSGHGAPNPKTGDAYLVPYDGDPSFIDQTGYSIKRLYESLGKLQAKEIIVALDSCFSGAGGRSVIAKGARPLVITMETLVIPSKIAVLSAASGDQISSTYEEKGHGLFTYFMLKGIKGEGDTNGDGKIEIGELFNYIKPQVELIARKVYNNEQLPQMIAPNELIKQRLIERQRIGEH
ncbi:MAG: ankyrin repeat domain-containing protein [Thermodesulfobacteriota bacterium]